MTPKIDIIPSSGNVFADLGLANSDEMMVKAELLRQIAEIITQQQMTDLEAAKLLAIDLPQFSDLIKGKLTAFSTELLFQCLNTLGCDVEIVIKPKPQSRIVIYHDPL